MIDISSSLPFIYFKINGVYCKGHPYAWYLANCTGALFFILFMNFYLHTYKQNQSNKNKENDDNTKNEKKSE
eukprot:TRINITY_DN132716_c0_g1_i1.p1 TRINITY_DN132716_c0_g1~~TRINITY_DN132716_c0_g1_i1.p1  ORF type:complete len:72 (+),score=19.78 TRINITY_DN132716_c0_g1_i1:250-465(+)